MINFFKQIFVWWHRQTIGTFIYTLFTGKLVGIDEFGNKYYSNTKGKRWVIYSEQVESSKIPPEWHLWIHFLKNNKPWGVILFSRNIKPQDNLYKYKWQKKHQENLTGTIRAYKPDGSLASDSKKNMKKYESWKY